MRKRRLVRKKRKFWKPYLWKPCLSYNNCKCAYIKKKKLLKIEKTGEKKFKSNRTGLSEGKPLLYPFPLNNKTSIPKIFKTFQIEYEGTLSLTEIELLNSFRNKYMYYAIDDILYLFNLKSQEQKKLLLLLYSTMLSLQNDLSINFFDIWIDAFYINDTSKNNKFLTSDYQNLKQVTYITLKLYYITRSPIKKAEPIW